MKKNSVKHRRRQCRCRSLWLAAIGAATLALAVGLASSGTAVGQPEGTSQRAHASGRPAAPRAHSWSTLDLALDRANQTPGLIGTHCMPHGSPGSTLIVDSRRLTGAELERSATSAIQSREFVALHRALRDRGFHTLRSRPYGRASAEETLIVLAYGDSRGRGALAGLLVGNGRRRAEARFTSHDRRSLLTKRLALVVDRSTSRDGPLTARAAALDPLCLGVCLATQTAKCRTGASRCVPLASTPVVGTAAFLACAAVICGPETIRCIRKCL
jgi:hypothetical protein